MHFDMHFEQWNQGKYTVGDRRIMLTQWVGQAWKEFHEESSDVIRRAFRKLGLSLAIDGSEDDELHVEDLPGIEVGNWRRNNEEEIETAERIDERADEGTNDETNKVVTDENIRGGYEYVLRDEIGSNIEENDGGEDNSGDSEMDEE